MTSSTTTAIARYLYGIIFVVFGLNGFLHFLPMPPAPKAAADFGGALMQTGYMFPFIKGTEVLAGLLLLADLYVPLALTVLAPIVLNILAFHAFLAPAGMPVPLLVLALEVFLAYQYRGVFAPMLRARVAPSSSSAAVSAASARRAAA
ncbi:MAG: hypothetical protein RL701_6094 [Pseudomonadota bacterium]|jgi:uncharacterized membrane protein YphA (DoxX/SURF4 family)